MEMRGRVPASSSVYDKGPAPTSALYSLESPVISTFMEDMVNRLKEYHIGVLAGGSSSERDISLKSGRAVLSALERRFPDVVFIDVNEKEFTSQVEGAGIDLAFIALHGRFGEDGVVQEILDGMGISYTGSGPEASRLAMDKFLSKECFAAVGLATPEGRLVEEGNTIMSDGIRFPCVVKPRYEGSSIGLTVVLSEKEFPAAMEKALRAGQDIIVEDFVPGREITVGVLEDEALPPVEIKTAGGVYDFDAKYSAADTVYTVPAELEESERCALSGAGLAAHRALGCRGFSRVDIRFTEEGRPYVLEVNTIPGLTERSLLPMAAGAVGLDFSGLCVKMLCGAISPKKEV